MKLHRRMPSEKKPVLKGYTLYDFICRALLKWKDCRNGKQTNGCPALGRWWGWREISRQGWNMMSWEITAVMEMLCILTLLMSVTQPWYCTIWPNHTDYFLWFHLWPAVLLTPFCITELYLLTGNVSKSAKFHTTFDLCPGFHLVQKLEECLFIKVIYFKHCVNTMVGLLEENV